jgi:hypothetical protein
MSNVSQFIGSGWVPLETIELTGAVTTVDFDSNIDDTFNNYVVTGTHTLSVNGAVIYCKLKTGGVTINTGYRYVSNYSTGTSSGIFNQAFITTYSGSFIAYFMNLRSSDAFKSIATGGIGYDSTFMFPRYNTNALLNTSIINGIQLYPSSGNINTGKFTLYGIKEL